MRRTLLLVLVALGCGDPKPAEVVKPAAAEKVLVAVAASGADAIEKIGAKFTKATGVAVIVNPADSGTLAQQIANGSSDDLFLSANQKWADFLAEKGQVAQRVDLVGNELVLVVPSDSSLPIAQPEDLLKAEISKIAIADPDVAPAGIYAKEALTKLALWEKLKAKTASVVDVRATLIFVEKKEAEAGFVYATDAAITSKVKVVYRFPVELTKPIRYPLVLTKTGASRPAAGKLYDYLQTPDAFEVFQELGFQPLPPPTPVAK